MEALVAVGLASNIVSFIDFGSKLIRTASELRDSAASADNEAHAVVITHFEKLAEQMSNSAQGISNASTSPSPLEQSLIPLANGCCHLAKKLLQRLDDLSILSSQKDSRLRRTKTAIKCLWTQREVNETANQLHHFRSEICLHLVHQVRQSQETLQGYQASKDDVQHLLAKVEALQTPIEDMRLGLHEKLDNHHSEILNSVNQSETKSLEYKNDITNAIVSSTREIQDSQVSLIQDLTRQIKNQHSITGDSIGQVRVENSAFYAQAMEVIRPGNHPSSSLLSPLMGFLEEYQHTLLATAKKELQGSVELELKKIQETVFQAAYEAQTRNKEYHHEPNNTQNSGSCSKEYDDTGKLYAEKSRQTEREYTCGERRPRRKRSDISLIYANRWTVETSFGMLILSIQEIAVFDSNRLEYSVYEIAAQLNPFPQWLSTGCSITYRKTTDAQRNSDFNFRPKIYRVLSRDHRVWEAILGDDVESVRTRLAQKVVGPSDCTEDGMTILHVAVLCGKLEICKTLVASGADINARDRQVLVIESSLPPAPMAL
ncbi:hypothetical protein F4778DRAFT_169 [Xylariomycetidae sp. FL2044]|nr:hypothetical protein F4778DRAFT_169 [Xylariomycetidae sp. FL2044]